MNISTIKMPNLFISHPLSHEIMYMIERSFKEDAHPAWNIHKKTFRL